MDRHQMKYRPSVLNLDSTLTTAQEAVNDITLANKEDGVVTVVEHPFLLEL